MREDDRSAAPTQSAALPYRARDGQVEVLLVTSRGGRGWIIPKGKIEARLGSAESARREAREEGGVDGEIDSAPFDQYRHGGDGGPLVEVYLMRASREMRSWLEQHQRERRWVPAADAAQLVTEAGLQRVLRDAAAHLASLPHREWTTEQAHARAARRLGLAGSALLVAAACALLALALGG